MIYDFTPYFAIRQVYPNIITGHSKKEEHRKYTKLVIPLLVIYSENMVQDIMVVAHVEAWYLLY